MAGELQYDSAAGPNQGKLLYCEAGANTGKLVYECCCDNVGVDCEDCPDDPTPLKLIVVVSGVDLVTDCCACNAHDPEPGDEGVKWNPAPALTPNGTFTLTQTANPCIWDYTEATSGVWQVWTGDDCTGSVLFTYKITAMYIQFRASDPPATKLYITYETGAPTMFLPAYYGEDVIGESSCWQHASNNACDCPGGCGIGIWACAAGRNGSATVDIA